MELSHIKKFYLRQYQKDDTVTHVLDLLLGKYQYNGSISTSTVFDYFPYLITEKQMKLSAVEFMEELKNQCEPWRVICELEQLH